MFWLENHSEHTPYPECDFFLTKVMLVTPKLPQPRREGRASRGAEPATARWPAIGPSPGSIIEGGHSPVEAKHSAPARRSTDTERGGEDHNLMPHTRDGPVISTDDNWLLLSPPGSTPSALNMGRLIEYFYIHHEIIFTNSDTSKYRMSFLQSGHYAKVPRTLKRLVCP